jgi:hypothetical protein
MKRPTNEQLEAPKDEKRRQVWFCTDCGAVGVVVYTEEDGDVWTVAQRIREAHRAATDTVLEPKIVCVADAKIIVLENITKSVRLRGPHGRED